MIKYILWHVRVFLDHWLSTDCPSKSLVRLRRTGWSESSLGARPKVPFITLRVHFISCGYIFSHCGLFLTLLFPAWYSGHTEEMNRNVPKSVFGRTPSEDSDQPALSRRLIRIFTRRMLDRKGYKVSPCEQLRLWLDSANAQADLNIRWMRMTEDVFWRCGSNTPWIPTCPLRLHYHVSLQWTAKAFIKDALTEQSICCSQMHKGILLYKWKSKRLPLAAKSTQKKENRILGFIKSLHIQHRSLRGCIRPHPLTPPHPRPSSTGSSYSNFTKYREKFYGRHRAFYTSRSEEK